MITIPGAGPLRQYAILTPGGVLVTADHPAELRAYLKWSTLPFGDGLVVRLGRCDVVDRHASLHGPRADDGKVAA